MGTKSIAAAVLAAALSGCMNAIPPPEMAPNPGELQVSYEWSKEDRCDWISPEIHVEGIPEGTRYLHVTLKDLDNRHPDIFVGVDHGGKVIPYSGGSVLPRGAIDGTHDLYVGPCPSNAENTVTDERYEFTVIALDQAKHGIAKGSTVRTCCKTLLEKH